MKTGLATGREINYPPQKTPNIEKSFFFFSFDVLSSDLFRRWMDSCWGKGSGFKTKSVNKMYSF